MLEKEQIKTVKHSGPLTFSYRVAHDKIGPSREGVNSAGVYHHLVCLQLAVHSVTGGHWIIMLVSAACLVTNTATFIRSTSKKQM